MSTGQDKVWARSRLAGLTLCQLFAVHESQPKQIKIAYQRVKAGDPIPASPRPVTLDCPLVGAAAATVGKETAPSQGVPKQNGLQPRHEVKGWTYSWIKQPTTTTTSTGGVGWGAQKERGQKGAQTLASRERLPGWRPNSNGRLSTRKGWGALLSAGVNGGSGNCLTQNLPRLPFPRRVTSWRRGVWAGHGGVIRGASGLIARQWNPPPPLPQTIVMKSNLCPLPDRPENLSTLGLFGTILGTLRL